MASPRVRRRPHALYRALRAIDRTHESPIGCSASKLESPYPHWSGGYPASVSPVRRPATGRVSRSAASTGST